MTNDNNLKIIQELISNGKINKAVKKIIKRLEDQPNNVLLLEAYSECLLRKRMYKKNIEICEKGLSIDSNLIVFQYGLLKSYIGLNQTNNVKKIFSQIESKQDNSNSRFDIYCSYFLFIGDIPRLKEYSNLFLSTDQKNSRFYYYIGVVCYTEGNFNDALFFFTKAFNLKKQVSNFTAMIESFFGIKRKLFSIILLSILLLSFFIPFPIDYILVFLYYIFQFWFIFSGYVLGDKKRIKFSIFAIFAYLPLLFFFQVILKGFLKLLF